MASHAYCDKCNWHEPNEHDGSWQHCDCEPEKRGKNWIDRIVREIENDKEKIWETTQN